METFVKIIGIVVVALAIIFALSLLLAWPVKLLWNWLIPDIFGLIKINFWQSWGLLLLFGLLVKGSSSSSSKSKD